MKTPPAGLLADRFKAAYLRSLSDYRFFYDDIAEIGDPADARHAFYFVPGLNGAPGQMRFLLPSLVRVYGPRLYVKALAAPEFSTTVPAWEKYTTANVDRKLARLRADLAGMLDRFERFSVLCSSTGFYDFLAVAGTFDMRALESRVTLAWGACAPDRFGPTRWEKLFFPLNGFVHEGHRWFAYPNHNVITALNPETSASFLWREAVPRRLHKFDLESRFRCLGLQWDYLSTSQFAAAAAHVIDRIRRSWGGPAEALVAAEDGFWQGRPRAEAEAVIRRYLPRANCVFALASHLWVVNPTNVTALFERMNAHRPAPAPAAGPRPALGATR